MNNFDVIILGSGGAIPTLQKRPTSQVIHYEGKFFLIDCGEGTQLQLRKCKISVLKIHYIFISHLHGDHYFGLIGLLSSMHLLGRTKDLHIYCPPELKEIIDLQLKVSNAKFGYSFIFHFLESKESEKIYDGKSLEVHTIPLKHRIYTNGFLFKEKPRSRKIKAELIPYYNIPHYELKKIKEGADYINEKGEIIDNSKLTYPAIPSRSYAFCSDTAFREKIISIIKGVDLLYHEATFLESERELAKKTFHSTVKDAAKIAQGAEVKKLLIGHFSARYSNEDYPQFLREAKEFFDSIEIAHEENTFSI